MRILAALLSLLVLAGSAGEAHAVYSKVKYTLTLTYITSSTWTETAPGDPEHGYRPWSRHASSRDVYMLKSASPFWITRRPGKKPTFSGRADIVATGGLGLHRDDTHWGPAWFWQWREDTYPPGSLHGSASLPLLAGPSARIAFSFMTTFGVQRPRLVHLSDPAGNGTPDGLSYESVTWLKSKGGQTCPVELRKRLGFPFTASFTETKNSAVCPASVTAAPGLACTASHASSATLSFTPVAWVRQRGSRTPAKPKPEQLKPDKQRWQVDVLGRDNWRWGVITGLRAGVDVDWRQRTALEVNGDKILSAKSQVSVLNVVPVSEPPGVFTVTPTRKTWPAYELPRATKRGNRVTLNYYDGTRRSEYLVSYSVRLVGPQALNIMRSSGVPDADVRYAELVKRGPVTSTAATFVPDPARLVFLLRTGKPQRRNTDAFDPSVPCPRLATQDCLLSRGAQTIVVTKR